MREKKSETPYLTIENLGFAYQPETPVIKDLWLSVRARGLVCLMGRPKAGKSTLLSLLAGALLPQKGSARLLGADPAGRSADFYQKLFFVPKGPWLPNALPEKIGRAYGCFYPAYRQNRFWELIQILGAPTDIKVGQFKQVWHSKALALALALAAGPRCLLLCEPFDEIPRSRLAALRKALTDYTDKGGFCLYSSNRVEEQRLPLTRLLFLRRGNLRFNGRPDIRDYKQWLSVIETSDYCPINSNFAD